MNNVWFFYKQQTQLKCIRIGQNENANSIRKKIKVEFSFEPHLDFRIRNWRGNIVPINNNLNSNCKKSAFRIELYVPIVRKKILIDSIERVNRVTTALATKSIIYGFYQKLYRLETALKFTQNQLQKNLNNVRNFFLKSL